MLFMPSFCVCADESRLISVCLSGNTLADFKEKYLKRGSGNSDRIENIKNMCLSVPVVQKNYLNIAIANVMHSLQVS